MSENPQVQGGGNNAAVEDDRRVHERVPASRLQGIQAKLPTGIDVVLKDLSRSGARFQSDSRFLPGLSVALKVQTPDGEVAIRGRVVRSRLVRLDKGGMGYEAAVAFSELLPGFNSAPAPVPAPSPAASAPDASEVAAEPARDPASDGSASAGNPFAQTAAAPPGNARPAPESGVSSVSDEAAATEAKPAADAGDADDADAAAPEDDVPMMLLVTASVPQSIAEIREMFNGNDW